jgi:hypothetical protein
VSGTANLKCHYESMWYFEGGLPETYNVASGSKYYVIILVPHSSQALDPAENLAVKNIPTLSFHSRSIIDFFVTREGPWHHCLNWVSFAVQLTELYNLVLSVAASRFASKVEEPRVVLQLTGSPHLCPALLGVAPVPPRGAALTRTCRRLSCRYSSP